MKESILVALALASSICSFTQVIEANISTTNEGELPRTKQGHLILPEAGDIAIGFNAVPILNFALNTIKLQSDPSNGTEADDGIITYAQSANYQVVGKYFLTGNSAVRVRFGVNSLAGSRTTQVQDALVMATAVNGTQDDIDAASLIKVDDELSYRKSNVNLVAGYEKRRGYGRLQGFYGGEAGVNFTKSKAEAVYGNEFTDLHQVEYTSFTSNTASSVESLDPTSTNDASRFLNRTFSGGVGFGVRGFIGAEFFFARKMSIAAEYGWGYTYTKSSSSSFTQETYHNGQNGPVILEEVIDQDQSSSSHSIGIDNNASGNNGFSDTFSNTGLGGSSGSITLALHF